MDNYLIIILIVAIIAILYFYQDRIFGCKPKIITYEQIKKNKLDNKLNHDPNHDINIDNKSNMSIDSEFNDMFKEKELQSQSQSQLSFNDNDNISIYSGLSNGDMKTNNSQTNNSVITNNSPMSMLEY